jgi:hypothetical protein
VRKEPDVRGSALDIVITAVLHGSVVLGVHLVSIRLWGRPGGIGYGVTLYYSGLGLLLIGLAQAAMFRSLTPNAALAGSLVLIAGLAVAMFPERAEPTYVVFAASAGFGLALWWLRWGRRSGRWRRGTGTKAPERPKGGA